MRPLKLVVTSTGGLLGAHAAHQSVCTRLLRHSRRVFSPLTRIRNPDHELALGLTRSSLTLTLVGDIFMNWPEGEAGSGNPFKYFAYGAALAEALTGPLTLTLIPHSDTNH